MEGRRLRAAWPQHQGSHPPQPPPSAHLHHLLDEVLVGHRDVRLDGSTLGRRGGDERRVPEPGYGHVHGARDGCGGHGQNVNLGLEPLDGLLLGHAEPLARVPGSPATT